MLAHKAQWAIEAELRELREENKRLKSEGKKQAVQLEETSVEAKPDEDCKRTWIKERQKEI